MKIYGIIQEISVNFLNKRGIMGTVVIRGHNVTYIDSIHIDPSVFTSNPAVAMVAPIGVGTLFLLNTFIGAAIYKWCFTNAESKLSFEDLVNVGGRIGMLLTTPLILQDPIAKHGIIKTASDLYDSHVFALEAWPQVLLNELMGINNQED